MVVLLVLVVEGPIAEVAGPGILDQAGAILVGGQQIGILIVLLEEKTRG
jgi:hypothetical protein